MNPIAQQTAKWRSCRPCLRLSTNLGPRIAFWGPDLGHILVPVSGSIFGHRFGPLQLQTKSRAPKRGPKMEPKTRTKIGPKSGPKMQSGAPNLRTRKKGRVEIIFIQRSAGRSYSIVQQTNNFNQRRKGNLGGQDCSNREHEYIHRPNILAEDTQSSLTHGKINSMLATMGVRPCVTAKLPVLKPWFWSLILLNLAAASCYFIASLGGRVRCKHPSIGRSKMWNCQCPTPAGCICSNSETL